MSQTDYNDDVITWSIDRNPDHNILNQYVGRRIAIIEEPDDTYNINVGTMRNLTGGDIIHTRDYINPIYNHNDEDDEYYNYNYNMDSLYNNIRNNMFLQNDDFIPFNNRSEASTPSINFIVDEFLLSPEELNCCICMEEQEDHQICQLNCHHTFCVACIDQHLERNSTCPLCREHISRIRTQTMESRHQIHH